MSFRTRGVAVAVRLLSSFSCGQPLLLMERKTECCMSWVSGLSTQPSSALVNLFSSFLSKFPSSSLLAIQF